MRYNDFHKFPFTNVFLIIPLVTLLNKQHNIYYIVPAKGAGLEDRWEIGDKSGGKATLVMGYVLQYCIPETIVL